MMEGKELVLRQTTSMLRGVHRRGWSGKRVDLAGDRVCETVESPNQRPSPSQSDATHCLRLLYSMRRSCDVSVDCSFLLREYESVRCPKESAGSTPVFTVDAERCGRRGSRAKKQRSGETEEAKTFPAFPRLEFFGQTDYFLPPVWHRESLLHIVLSV